MSQNAVIRSRRDTAANWTSVNPVLDAGELGIETNTHKLKAGDGATAWASLSYLTSAIADADYGDITIASGVWSIDNGVVTLAKMADMATASLIYRKTAGSGAPEVNTLATLKTDLGLTGTNSGDQTITLTGPVTGSGTGSFATTITANAVGTTQIADAAVTLAKQANMATASVVYRKTAGSGAPEVQTLATLKTDLGLTGTNSGDQTITLTGPVTGSGTGSFATSVTANAITDAMLAQVATATFKGRTTAGTGNVEVLTATQATALLNVFTSALKGLAPASGGGTVNFLRADGTWAAPPGGGGALTDADYGDITVSGSGTVMTIDAGVVTLAKMANMATSSLIYRKTAGAGVPEVNTLATLKTDLGLTGTNSGDQTITLSGDISGSGTGAITTVIGAGKVTLAMQANMATASVVYRKTAGAGAPEVQTLATLKTDLGLTGTNSGDQTITLTGDVTGSGTGSFAATIGAGAVTLAKMANLAANSILGNNTGSAATPIALTPAQTKTLLAIASTDVSGLGTAAGVNLSVGTVAPGSPSVGDLWVDTN